MTVHSSGEQIEGILATLRAEEPHEQEAAQQALLHYEIGVLEEARGDAEAAAREQLAACDTEPAFREPLEALVRLYQRNRDNPELPRLLEALVDGATTPAESARALRELAAYRLDVEHDRDQAKACLEAAVETAPNDVACWLEYELVAAADGDSEARQRALEARQHLTTTPTWQGLLLTDLAELCAEAGDVGRASELLDTAAALEGRARFGSRLALERIAAAADEPELQAHALAGQAELLAQGIDDPQVAARAGVPSVMCTQAQVVDAWLRAGELLRRAGNAESAVRALSAAANRLEGSALVARLRIAAADAAGDEEVAVALARQQLERGVGGAVGATLWVRLGQASEAHGDDDSALQAYGQALELDPQSIVALTLRTDLLARGEDPEALAEALEAQAEQAGSQTAQRRAWLVVGYVWAVRVGSIERGKRALGRAAELAADPVLVGRLARLLAELSDDPQWYSEATEQLLDKVDDAEQRASLCFEMGRARLRAKDDAGAVEAFAKLAAASGTDDAGEPSSWLGRVLAAYAVGLRAIAPEQRDGRLVARLAEAEPDRQLGRGLAITAAMLTARAGQPAVALQMLQHEHADEPGDVVAGLFLADLRRAGGDVEGAAEVLSAVAGHTASPAVAGALEIEAGLLRWRAGKRGEAVASFEQALEFVPEAARLVLAWALRAAEPDDAEARRRAIDLVDDSEDDVTAGALERVGMGLATRAGEADARAALDQLDDMDPGGDLSVAAAIGRLVHPAADSAATVVALEHIEQLGGDAERVAAAERFRLARLVDRQPEAALQAARTWAELDSSVAPCIEWLAAAFAADDVSMEVDARLALADRLDGDARDSLAASAALVKLVRDPRAPSAPIRSTSAAAALANLEIALPGGEPTRRAAALRAAGAVLGTDADRQAARMAAWSDLAAAAYGEAQAAFKELVEDNADDMASWEGLCDASDKVGDQVTRGVALARLGNLCQDDLRAAELWEQAGLVLLEHTDASDDAEIAFDRALERDRTRAVAFDKLFRAVRRRNEDDRLLELIDMRLEVTDDHAEITKMYWERARVMRRKGDQEGALKSLNDVTLLEPDHVGALALSGEISITRGDFAGAAPLLAKLATLDEAPKQQRLMSGVAAVDLYDKKLGKPEKALEVLVGLYRDGLSTIKVRERLARTAARVGEWAEAVQILERLMEERDSSKGRAEAARLAMNICRDKLAQPERAASAVRKLLEEVPDDAEAIRVLMDAEVSERLRVTAIPKAQELMLRSLAKAPFDQEKVELVAAIAERRGQIDLRRAALGVAVALGNDDDATRAAITQIDARSDRVPELVLDAQAILAIADDHDVGPIPEIFAQVAPVVSEALGPSLRSEGVGKKQRLEGGDALRIEVSRWMGALGFGDFELYVGGRGDRLVRGVAGERPGLVVGPGIKAPLTPAGRSAVAREVFALRRGTTSVMYFDEHTVASIVHAVCIDCGVRVEPPRYAVYGEVERVIKKAMSRRVRKAVTGSCERFAASRPDAIAWVEAARRSIDRMALIASGDAASVVDQIIGSPEAAVRADLQSNVRVAPLLVFALSTEYLELRQKLGMGAK